MMSDLVRLVCPGVRARVASVPPDVSVGIRTMGFVSAVLICMLHVSHVPTVESLSYPFWILIHECLGRIGVPFYFCVAGYLLASHVGEVNWWSRAIKTRFRTLVIPFLIFNAAYLVETQLLPALVNGEYGSLGLMTFVRMLGLDPLAHPTLGPTWFIRTLFIYVVLSPVFALVMRTKSGGAIALATLFVGYAIVSPWDDVRAGTSSYFFHFLLSMEGMFYFSLGMWLRQYYPALKMRKRALVVCMSLLVLVIGGSVLCAVCGLPYVWLSWISIQLSVIVVWNLLIGRQFFPWLSNQVFPIYLLHRFVIFVVTIVLGYFTHSRVLTVTLPLYVTALALSVCGTLVAVAVFRTAMPKVAAFMLGGR